MRWLMVRKKKKREVFWQQYKKEILRAAVNSRHLEIAGESMELLESTLNPRTFFGRCDDIAFSEERVTGASEFLKDTELLTRLQVDFIDRMLEAGRIAALKEGMEPYVGRLTAAALVHYRRVVSAL